MSSFRLVLCLTGLLAYVIGRHFTSSEDRPVILTGPGQNTAVGLRAEQFDPGSLVSKPVPAPAILKDVPEQNAMPAEDPDNATVSSVATEAPLRGQSSHLTLNAAAALR